MEKSFLIHEDYIEDLDDSLKPVFLMIIYNYGIHGIEPNFSSNEPLIASLKNSIWLKIKRRIDSEKEKYKEVSEKRAAASRNRKNISVPTNLTNANKTEQTEQNEQMITNANKTEQNEQMNTEYVYDYDNDYEYDNDSVTVSVSDSASDAEEKAENNNNWGYFQKKSYELITTHNKSSPHKIFVPSFITYLTKDCREIVSTLKAEGSENILKALENYIKISELDNAWQQYFSLKDFIKNYSRFCVQNFDISLFTKKCPENNNADDSKIKSMLDNIPDEIE